LGFIQDYLQLFRIAKRGFDWQLLTAVKKAETCRTSSAAISANNIPINIKNNFKPSFVFEFFIFNYLL